LKKNHFLRLWVNILLLKTKMKICKYVFKRSWWNSWFSGKVEASTRDSGFKQFIWIPAWKQLNHLTLLHVLYSCKNKSIKFVHYLHILSTNAINAMWLVDQFLSPLKEEIVVISWQGKEVGNGFTDLLLLKAAFR